LDALGFKSNTHPTGAILAPLNPLTATLGISNVSFLAQTIDWNPAHLYETIKAAHDHRGFSLVNIIQRCPVYSPEAYEHLQQDQSEKNILRLFPNQQEHDPSNMSKAYEFALPEMPKPVGLLYHNPEVPCYARIWE